MTKEKRMTLNAEKRKVIADQFQSFYEDKVKDKLIQAKEQYDLMREKAKEKIEQVVRYHQPQEDVETIRRMRACLLYTSPSPRDLSTSRMPSSA